MARKKNWYDDDSHGPWSDFATEASNFSANELSMDDTSYNQRTCEGVASMVTAGVGSGAFVGGAAYSGAKSAGTSMVEGTQDFNEWSQGLSDPEDGVYPYTRFREDEDW